MRSYNTMIEALDDLKRRGYTADLDLQPHCVKCGALQIELHPEDFEIIEVYRFEGANDPGDSNVVYAIAGKNGLNGVLVNAYGAYSNSLTAEMLEKLTIRH